DVVDYSRLIREDKEGTLERLKAHRDQLLHPKVRENCGRIVRVAGGSLLAEFTDPTAAVQCAVELQRGMIARNAGTAPNRRIAYRVSVNIGETTSPSDDLVLRAVAALPVDQLARLIKPGSEDCGERGSAAMRTAELAEPGGICITEAVFKAVRDRLRYPFADIGKHEISFRAPPVRCYAMSAASVASRPRASWGLRRPALAASVAATAGVWAVALWAWLGANPSPSPIPAPATAEMHASRIEPVATAAHPVAREPSTPETPVVSSAAPDGGSPASSELQPSPPSNADAGAPAPSPPQPTVVGLGKALVRGNPLPAQLQATPDSGTVVVRGNKPPSALQTVSDSGVAVVRGHQASSSTRQAVVDGATEVVRGNRAPSGPSFSTVALPFDHPPSSHPDQE
ncbi:MAG: hypothetical protein JO229_13255, partial [Alphaproteobacteria bacterium]|nr:hypothetical protein [Alphaproteobacteria bacterium]